MNPNNDWQNQMREALATSAQLAQFLQIEIADTPYPLFIPKPFARKIQQAGPASPLWKQFIPGREENETIGLLDPIGDQVHAKTGKIIHRYKNRVLFTPTSVCPIHCRYCFRKNELYTQTDLFSGEMQQTIDYLNSHPEIEEVIFTGGDPLILSNKKLENYLDAFTQTPVKYIRLHSRTPIILPQRIDSGFLNLIEKFQSRFTHISMAVHTNHIEELYPEVRDAFNDLSRTRIQMLAQTVLLKGINDTSCQLIELFNALVESHIRPYYLHHPDQVQGGMHFWLPLEQGRKIYAQLRNQLPGWAIPHYVIDIPGGEGKVSAFNPENFEFSGTLINKNCERINSTLDL